ncbi:signaling lymphocytic activation molecule-like [Dendropsophus ebraccatus]|uniref:signaling lymphocytic activation molecule-like n=1 Tax=Dendropsophus ebraccatus TaxID=150705 RepID=UPI00383202D6
MSVFRCVLFYTAVCHFGESKLCEHDIKLDGILGESLTIFKLSTRSDYEKLLLKSIANKTKTKLLSYKLKGHESHHHGLHSKYIYHENNKSVMINNLQRGDEKNYELTVEQTNGEEEFCNIKVKVYEGISNLTVSVTEDSRNDTCKVIMKCLMQTGENVTISWMKDDENLSHDSSTLEISITSDNANSTYTCTARNSVNEQSSNHTLSSACNPSKDNSLWYLMPYTPVLLVIFLPIVVVLVVVIKRKCNKGQHKKQCTNPSNGEQSRPPAPAPVLEETPDPTHTVYATVKKSENSNRPFSSVYELAGPSDDNSHIQSRNSEDTRI